jgi:predicted small secreted protein
MNTVIISDMRRVKIRGVFIRFIVALLLAIAIAGYLSISQSRALKLVDEYTENLTTLVGSYVYANRDISQVPEPQSLKLGAKGTIRSYAANIDKIKDKINIQTPAKPNIKFSVIKSDKITQFNEITENDDYINLLKYSDNLSVELESFLTYFTSSMRVMANLLEYDPILDLSITNSEALISRLAAAGEGLAFTAQKIDELAGFEDQSKTELKQLVSKTDSARQAYQLALIENRPSDSERQNYIDTVHDSQDKIILNRQKFWSTKIDDFTNELVSTEGLLKDYLYKLNRN